MPKKVLCVCKGNGDRSPLMAAVLQMFFKNAGRVVQCESAGILEVAAKGGSASPYVIVAGRRIGIDLSGHCRRQIDSLGNLNTFDLFVCVDEEVAERVLSLGVHMAKICNVQVSNPWPSRFQVDHDQTAEAIMGAMYRVVTRHF